MSCFSFFSKNKKKDARVHHHEPVVSKKVAIVIWDIENVRLPAAPIKPGDVVRAIKQTFATDAGFPMPSMVCCVTPCSLRAMERKWPAFVHDVVADMDIRVASKSRPKLGSDYVLKRVFTDFIDAHAECAHDARVILITGDADFIEPVQRATRLGFDVQLVCYGGNASRFLLPAATACTDWETFLALPPINNVTPLASSSYAEAEKVAAVPDFAAAAREARDAKMAADVQEAKKIAQEATKIAQEAKRTAEFAQKSGQDTKRDVGNALRVAQEGKRDAADAKSVSTDLGREIGALHIIAHEAKGDAADAKNAVMDLGRGREREREICTEPSELRATANIIIASTAMGAAILAAVVFISRF